LNQKIPSSGWDPGPGNLSQNGQKPTLFMMSYLIKWNQKPKIYFSLQA